MKDNSKPTIHQADLTKLPRALGPLIERPQWAIWRYTQLPNGKWQKPPFMATQRDRHVSTNDPSTWTDYATAVAAVQAGHGDGISYILTEEDPFAAIDIDNCRHLTTHSIDAFAQLSMQFAVTSYQEVTPSGEGVRIWGLANGATLHKNFRLEIDGKEVGIELFRRTPKALTITGYRLNTVRELTNIDKVLDWEVIRCERRKAAAINNTVTTNGHHFNGDGSGYSIDQIEQIVRDGAPAGANRSDVFHSIVGHYVGCGWDVDRILAHMQEFPDGIGERYIREDRLHREIARSAGKFAKAELPSSGAIWTNGWDAKAPAQPEPDPHKDQDIEGDAEEVPADDIDDDLDPDLDDDVDGKIDDGIDEDLLRDIDPELEEDSEENPEDDLEEDPQEEPKRRSDLPPMYCYGDPDTRPIKSWAIKHVMPTVGHGILGGQWGTFKTFIGFDVAACLMTAQPFLGYPVKRQCGVLFIAAEGADEVRLRSQAVINAKCGNMSRAPFCWYETAPTLLHKDAVDKLAAMGEQAAAVFKANFDLPLGLIIVDTMAVAAGYREQGAENDSAIVTAVMRVLKDTAERLSCFVLGLDHFGKNVDAGLKGSVAKEIQADLILVCLGERELSGSVTNTRLAIRKCRGGPQGQVFPFTTRVVELLEKDEDGEPYTTLVIDWQPVPPGGAAQEPLPKDPWAKSRRQDQRTAVLRLKRVLMSILADQGVELAIPPDGPIVRMVEQGKVRKQFYLHTPDEDSTDKVKSRRQQFTRARDWAEAEQLIAVEEIDDVTYLRLIRPDPNDDED
jgi:AAA domain